MQELFDDRLDAGRRLGAALQGLDLRDPVVLALPRGGVPVGAEVARLLKAPLDLVLVRKIGAPSQPELAVAAVAEGVEPALEVDDLTLRLAGASMDHVRQQIPAHLAEIARRRRVYLKDRAPLELSGRTAVLVDDGIATGTTMRAAIQAVRRRHPARLVVAVPVAPPGEAARLRRVVDDCVCLAEPAFFGAVGAHYRRFEQTTDAEVIDLMEHT